jgi:cyclic pyranopterin phosphate synthase
LDLLDHFRESGHTVRLIEFLDVGSSNHWQSGDVVPGHEWLQKVGDRWPLRKLDPEQPGETARRYAYEDGGGEFGLINSITQPFCHTCSRVRVTADGTMYTCLFSDRGISLKPLLQDLGSSRNLEHFIDSVWTSRDDRYSETRHLNNSHKNSQEMYRMGG